MAEPDADTIRLSVPVDEDMRPVVEVTIGVLARRWGLSDDQVASARAAAGDALTELAQQGGDGPAEVEVHATPRRLVVRITHAGRERTFHAPPA